MTVYSRLPPYMLRIIADTKRHWKYRRPSYTGAYSSFDEATANSPPPRENPWWASYVVTVLGRPPNLLGSRMLLPVVAATLGSETNTLNILDFGGGGGFDFRNLLTVLGKDAAVNYTVVDQPRVCEAARAKWAGEPRISFRNELPPSSTFFDLVYSFSALQYVRDPTALVAQLGGYAAKAVLIAGVPFGEQAFVRKETTRGLDTPSWVVSLSDTAKQMEKSGYRLALTLPGEDWWNVDNYSGDQKVGRMTSMLFLNTENRISALGSSADAKVSGAATSTHTSTSAPPMAAKRMMVPANDFSHFTSAEHGRIHLNGLTSQRRCGASAHKIASQDPRTQRTDLLPALPALQV